MSPEETGLLLQTEITNRANVAIEQYCQMGGVEPTEDDRYKLQVGVQAGMAAAMQVLSERGWLQVTL